MTVRFVRASGLGLLALGLALAGCLPPPAGSGDEAKEPYFRRGEELAASQDVPGAGRGFREGARGESAPLTGALPAGIAL
jgi:hypothetical protein